MPASYFCFYDSYQQIELWREDSHQGKMRCDHETSSPPLLAGWFSHQQHPLALQARYPEEQVRQPRDAQHATHTRARDTHPGREQPRGPRHGAKATPSRLTVIQLRREPVLSAPVSQHPLGLPLIGNTGSVYWHRLGSSMNSKKASFSYYNASLTFARSKEKCLIFLKAKRREG